MTPSATTQRARARRRVRLKNRFLGAGCWAACTIFFLLIGCGNPAFASDESDVLIAEAKRLGLANHPQWHALLHYRGPPARPRKSRVLSPSFYLHPDGRTRSDGELYATIRAYFEPTNQPDGEHPRCRFPARYLFLAKHIDLPEKEADQPECSTLAKWQDRVSAGKASLVFVDGYFGNPASFFGHALLTFGSRDRSRGELLSTSINYGAKVPENENGIKYLAYGLFGGYRAAFAAQDFFHHDFSYTDVNQRMMWSFELNIQAGDVELLEAHVWELAEVEFKYMFLRDNCGFEMMKLAQTVMPDLRVAWKPWFAPRDLFVGLQRQADREGNNLAISPRVSLESEFRAMYWAASVQDRRKIRSIAREMVFSESRPPLDFKVDEVAVLDGLLLFSRLPGVKDQNEVPAWRQSLLRNRIQHGSASKEPRPTNASPSRRQRTTMVGLGIARSPNGEVARLRLRPAYTDLNAIGTDLVDAYTLTAVDLTMHLSPSEFDVHAVDFLRVESMGIPSTPLSIKSDLAWRAVAGGRTRMGECQDCFDFDVEAGLGKGTRLGRWAAGSLLATAKARTAPASSGRIALGPSVVLLGRPSRFVRAEIRLDTRYYPERSEVQAEWMAQSHFGTLPMFDVWLRADGMQRDSTIAAGFSHYW